jgi:primosomal protein N' (replication factor Y)
MIAHVALPLPLHKTFSYTVPKIWESFVTPLLRVAVPFGNRMLTGFILTLDEGEDETLKELADILDIFPLIESTSFELCEWASGYYLAPIGVVLKYALPPRLKVAKYLLIRAKHEQARNLDGLPVKTAYGLVGKWVVWDYYHQGFVELYDSYTGSPFKPLAQSQVAEGYQPGLYVADIEHRQEEYLSIISQELDQGQNVLMLLPDYHIIGDHFYRFLAEALGKRVLWHTSAQPRAQMETFFRARTEEGCLILGNKSAVLLPVINRGLIIVERPEEDEYRNEEAFHFHAVKLALKSAELYGTSVLLGSASPPLDIVRLAREGAFSIKKEQDLCLGRSVAEVFTEGRMRDQVPPELAEIIDRTVREKETMAIYTPRKDYASRLYCLECKKPFLCPDCETPLAYYREGERLVCSACKKSLPYDETCAHCGGSLIQFFSTGGEYVEERLGTSVPAPHLLRISGESLRKKDVRSLLQVAGAPGTIVIGTQILSRLYGLRVKRLVLMGQEEFLWVAGYRAHERVYQTFRNLIDALKPEEIFLVVGKKSLIDVSHLTDEDRFYTEELAKRRLAEFPPYVRLFLIQVRKKGAAGERLVGRIVERFKQEGLDEHLMGPMRTKRGGVHWRMVLRGDEHLFAPVFPWLYGLAEVRIEPDPPTI